MLLLSYSLLFGVCIGCVLMLLCCYCFVSFMLVLLSLTLAAVLGDLLVFMSLLLLMLFVFLV